MRHRRGKLILLDITLVLVLPAPNGTIDEVILLRNKLLHGRGSRVWGLWCRRGGDVGWNQLRIEE
jgi:hypothetical protein